MAYIETHIEKPIQQWWNRNDFCGCGLCPHPQKSLQISNPAYPGWMKQQVNQRTLHAIPYRFLTFIDYCSN
jgi:hypothetical protein